MKKKKKNKLSFDKVKSTTWCRNSLVTFILFHSSDETVLTVLSEDSHFVTASVQDSKQRTITEMFQTSFTADDEDSLLEATNDWDDSPSGNTSGP